MLPVLSDDLVTRLTQMAGPGMTPTPLAAVSLIKVTAPGALVPEVHKPQVSFIVQGEKRLLIGAEILHYRSGDTYTAALDLPMRVEIIGCSKARPYLAINLRPDPALIADLIGQSDSAAAPAMGRAFAVHRADADLRDAYARLVRVLCKPDETMALGPLIMREILFRLLRGDQGAVLRRIAGGPGRGAGIASAIALIRSRYTDKITAKELANCAAMSVPSFYRRFKAETGMSPLQYRTQIRLYAARRRLLAGPGDIAGLAFALGYESPSHFSREYARAFGQPPRRDALLLQAEMMAGTTQNAA